jgi:hypothetical protein
MAAGVAREHPPVERAGPVRREDGAPRRGRPEELLRRQNRVGLIVVNPIAGGRG